MSQREIYAPRSAAIFVSPKQFNQLELLHNLSVSALERVHLFFLGGPVGTGDLDGWQVGGSGVGNMELLFPRHNWKFTALLLGFLVGVQQ